MIVKRTKNKEIAAAVGFAGSIRALAAGIDAAPNTVRYQVKRGYFSFDIATRVSELLALDLGKLQTNPDNGGAVAK